MQKSLNRAWITITKRWNSITDSNFDARVVVAAQGLWVKGQVAYLNVKVFNPVAKFYLTQSLNTAH